MARRLAAADERHVGCHDGHELDIRFQRQAAHVNNSVCYVLVIHPWFQDQVTIRLQSWLWRPSTHVDAGVANIDLAAGYVVGAAIQRDGLRQSGDRMLGRIVGRGMGPRSMRRN